jgi:hypothetical protein
MAENGLHFASVLEIGPGDYVVLDNLVIKVLNTPRKEIRKGIAKVFGKTASHVTHHQVEVTTSVSTEQLIPRLDDDFDLPSFTVDSGQILKRDEWPDLPVIYVDLAREVRYTDAFGSCEVIDASGFYVRRPDGDGTFHTYVSLDGESVLDQSSGDRIFSYRAAEVADFVAAGVH